MTYGGSARRGQDREEATSMVNPLHNVGEFFDDADERWDNVLRALSAGDLGTASDGLARIGTGILAVFNGGPGDDVEPGTPGNDRSFGGFGDDRLGTGAGNDLAVGGPGNDSLTAGAGLDVLAGGPDNDWLAAGEGVAILYGGVNDDVLHGGSGDAVLLGGSGTDTVMGGVGYLDIVHGGEDNDVIAVGAGYGVLIGGTGTDLFTVGPEIVGNGRVDVVVAIDFILGNSVLGPDQLLLDPAVRGAVAAVSDTVFDFGAVIGGAVIGRLRDHGVFTAEVADRIREAGVATLENELVGLLAAETPSGQALAAGAVVALAEGDLLLFAGRSAAELDPLI
jgi:Ca2+-binding RTX toxin-like protein